MIRVWLVTHESEGNRGCRQSNQPTIPRVGLVHCVGIVMAKLLDYPLYFFMLSLEYSISNNFLKPSMCRVLAPSRLSADLV